jgi:hypothetical protein
MPDNWNPEGWAVGDVARCVDCRPIRLPFRALPARGGDFLREGAEYPVRSVIVEVDRGLLLDVGAPHGPKLARRFVKVKPDEALCAAELELVA